MIKEVQVQRHAIDAILSQGGHAFKCANRFLVGVVDLSVKFPDMPHAFVEVKVVDWPLGIRATDVPLGLSTLQRNFLKAYAGAGGRIGWVIYAYREADRKYLVARGVDPGTQRVGLDTFEVLPSWKHHALHASHYKLY